MRVAILGCGYVGLELGRQLLVAGHDPVGIRRSESGLRLCEAAGFPGVAADLTDPESLEDVPDVDALAYTASPSRGDGAARAVRVRGIRDAVAHFAARSDPPTRLVSLSSTGVYGDRGGETVDEETPIDPQTDREQLLFDAETAAREAADRAEMTVTVVRLGGIYGPGRYRVERYLDRPVAAGT
ncbi:MAG: NAD-dependent epimerase/dehydratase family protein, partial [Halobacteriales archaeon]|nr:NAD-dependent epimerase/dehydratase family protein [Halobacteriales archaeon]